MHAPPIDPAPYTDVAVLVVAAGRGERLVDPANRGPKQYKDLGGKPVLHHTLAALAKALPGATLTPVIHGDDTALYASAIAELELPALRTPVVGGATRQQSVLNGLRALQNRSTPRLVLIHDGVRPFVDAAVCKAVLKALNDGAQAALPAIAISDSLKRAGPDHHVQESVARDGLFAAQTPQGFSFAAILRAHERAAEAQRFDFTDDTALIEWNGGMVRLVEGSAENVKITQYADLERARMKVERETLLAQADVRVGTGYDVHAFEDGDHAMLCGVKVPHTQTLKGHSDADVGLHALTDAIFAALADGDIGSHFPPSDPQWRGAASDQFLRYATDKVRARGGRIAHLDVTLICEAPKVGPHREAMRQSIAKICDVPLGRVAVKATTSERLGFTGREEGIAAMASATLRLPFEDELR
ncbi:bifunctional 2-C-methyl-D-erythritol 4-phosphate cytidylyltransferase/2-C-methyl-D-erythritol 2,4-cyclodiphosphate synthase [Polycladidibacter hongkongensis]|uniref:bifunctional 2-C-methyl-D-erythritol 4-phosphate cytidylyltransferase/2-C-methyl-D-erythritol 2,4-cyclodiphosphate synthase n=1 Tax=Polycladidibacter hongkongensis TaxID=1647556 RepID=UPI0009EC0064|nr:bifunctional 2-C-methyl-D-erythritol 4-phosphate cytidylyltransferase/2-C-methyl-D-erythritol 2,4-cyclodiphosphate synthase [Pseudovibrio hongkongensis]